MKCGTEEQSRFIVHVGGISKNLLDSLTENIKCDFIINES